METITFAELSTVAKSPGYMYNIKDEFETDDTFKDGSGYTYPSGANVYYTIDNFWDCLADTTSSDIVRLESSISSMIQISKTEPINQSVNGIWLIEE